MTAALNIRADRAGPLAMQTLLGVPLVGWCLSAARAQGEPTSIRIVGDEPRLSAYAQRHAVAVIPRAADAPPAPGAIDLDPRRPFAAHYLIHPSRAQASAADASLRAIEITDAASLEFARIVACGLPPDHPCRRGVTRLRLPLPLQVRAIVSDVDGVLTDGGIHFTSMVPAGRVFNTKDGLGHHLLFEASIRVGWLSATSQGDSILGRARMLGVEHVDAGKGDKGPRFTALCARLGVDPRQTVYLGDDVNDLPAMALAGASACPADADATVRARADLILDTPGGHGCFRELADLILDGIRTHP